MSGSFETKTLNFTGGTSSSTIKIETTTKRAFIDNVNIYYTSSNTITTTTPISDSPFCITTGTASVSVPFTITGTYTSNTFTAQLSDNTGSFATPTNIGTLISNVAGTINGTIPSSLTNGAGYKIRVISDSPSITGSMTSAFSIQNITNGGTPAYQWKLNGGNIGTNSSTYITSSLANNDVISCVMTPSGCVSPSTATSNNITMTVNSSPATPTASSNTPVCVGSTLNLISNATGTIAWTGPNGFTSALQNPSISNVTNAASGTYYVTSTSSGCTSAQGSTVVVIKETTATNPASVSVAVCAITTFGTTVTYGTSYQWQEYISGWIDITNGDIYSGATITTLTLTGVTIGMNGYKYRCVVTGSCSNITTNGLATLTVNAISYAHGDFKTTGSFT